jgi:hypothetical protein
MRPLCPYVVRFRPSFQGGDITSVESDDDQQRNGVHLPPYEVASETWEPHMTTNITKLTRAAGMAAVESGLLFRNQ